MNDHLKKCIAERRLVYSKPVQKNVKKEGSVSILTSDEIEKIYRTYCFIFSKGLANYSYAYEYEIRKSHVNHLINSVKVIQRAWRAYKLRLET